MKRCRLLPGAYRRFSRAIPRAAAVEQCLVGLGVFRCSIDPVRQQREMQLALPATPGSGSRAARSPPRWPPVSSGAWARQRASATAAAHPRAARDRAESSRRTRRVTARFTRAIAASSAGTRAEERRAAPASSHRPPGVSSGQQRHGKHDGGDQEDRADIRAGAVPHDPAARAGATVAPDSRLRPSKARRPEAIRW